MRYLHLAATSMLVVVLTVLHVPAPKAATHIIQMVGITFSPNLITIQEGDTITWHNVAGFSHTTTSGTPGNPDGIWNSGTLPDGAMFSVEFLSAGVFPFYCIPHGGLGMTGTVTVEAGPTGVGDPVAPKFTLDQNYPNPFNPSTTIKYMIDQPGFVELEVFNAQGHMVRTLVNDNKTPGPYQVRFDGRESDGVPLASGIYFYQLKIDGVALQTRKMVLIK